MKHLLDTGTTLSAMAGDPETLERLFALRRADAQIPQPVVAEILEAVARLSDPRMCELFSTRLDRLLEEAAVAPWTTEVSRAYAAIKKDLTDRGREMRDLEIATAAHALATEGVLVTPRTARMAWIRGLSLDNWSGPSGR